MFATRVDDPISTLSSLTRTKVQSPREFQEWRSETSSQYFCEMKKQLDDRLEFPFPEMASLVLDFLDSSQVSEHELFRWFLSRRQTSFAFEHMMKYQIPFQWRKLLNSAGGLTLVSPSKKCGACGPIEQTAWVTIPADNNNAEDETVYYLRTISWEPFRLFAEIVDSSSPLSIEIMIDPRCYYSVPERVCSRYAFAM